MSEQTPAASSPAEVQDVFNGENVSLADYSKYRQDGELPERFKPAETSESATDDTQEETETSEGEEPESASESETEEETQEQPQKGAEKRIKQLLAKTKELERKLAEKQDVKPESSTATPEPTAQYTRPKPTADDKGKDGKPKYETYEDFVEDLADWKAEQRVTAAERQRSLEAQQREINAKVNEARNRYENFDEVAKPFLREFVTDQNVPQVLKQMVNDSEVFADLAFTLADDEKFMAMAKSEPGKAIRYIAKVEGLIQEELAKGTTARDDSGKFAAKPTPEPKKTSAPKPPSPVGGGSSRAFDVSDESLSAEEWARKRNQDLQKRGR
jgi:hypothetical protein